jgi:hypothetical protein
VIDDGSTDRTVSEAGDAGATVISNSVTKGVGAVIRRGFLYAAERGFGIAVVMAGNSKDDGAQIPRLTSPIFSGKADFVQGRGSFPEVYSADAVTPCRGDQVHTSGPFSLLRESVSPTARTDSGLLAVPCVLRSRDRSGAGLAGRILP